ncbi:MAG: hypothetical protein WDN45_07610 [Caulobacteraceae bacterium]
MVGFRDGLDGGEKVAVLQRQAGVQQHQVRLPVIEDERRQTRDRRPVGYEAVVRAEAVLTRRRNESHHLVRAADDLVVAELISRQIEGNPNFLFFLRDAGDQTMRDREKFRGNLGDFKATRSSASMELNAMPSPLKRDAPSWIRVRPSMGSGVT